MSQTPCSPRSTHPTGTFYTVNRIHDTKSYSGVYQSVVVIDYDEKYLDYAPEGAYVARPNEVYFR